MFEGIALGTRIASVGQDAPVVVESGASQSSSQDKNIPLGVTCRAPVAPGLKTSKTLSMPQKLLMASVFAVITPIGMAIGIGVLQHFNGNDPSTLITLATLDALSAGILIWVGLVEMWARDWMLAGGEMVHAGAAVTTCGGLALVAGMALMSFLGKWA